MFGIHRAHQHDDDANRSSMVTTFTRSITKAATLGVFLSSCTPAPAPATRDAASAPVRATAERYSAGALRTDSTQYVARPADRAGFYAFTVRASYTNRTNAPVYFEWCGRGPRRPTYGISVAGIDPTGEGAAYNRFWACVGSDIQLELASGMTRVDTLVIAGPMRADGVTQRPLGMMEGDFQLVYRVRMARPELSPLLPDSLRRSNRFRVLLQR